MARLIDADALVDAIKDKIAVDKEIYPDDESFRFSRVGMRIVISIIKKQDTVDTVKHGHWIHSSSTAYLTVSCSECGYKVNHFLSTWQTAKYCPNCGARIDGVEK